ncbi:helix-turn-helix domain-containing protein [Rhizobium lentis]
MHPAALQRVVDRIEAEMHEDLSLALLAQDAGLSISAFVRAFRGSTGISPGEYLIRRRIYRASKLLTGSSLAIKEIARMCGFATHAHLTNVFRSRMGEPPASHRRLSRSMSRT